MGSSQTQQTKPPPSGPTPVTDPSGLNEAKAAEAVADIEENTTTTAADVEASMEKVENESLEKGDSGDADVRDNNDGDEELFEKEIIAKEDSGHGSDKSRKNSE